MPIAIQEDLLTGSTMLEKFRHAQSLGVEGVELWGAGLTGKVPEVVEAMLETGVLAAAVNHGAQGDLLAADPHEREAALVQLRQSVMNAVDVGAAGVVFVPHFGAPVLPDLSPWMNAAELEAEMLHMHLRTLSDYAEALGTDLYIKPVNRDESHLLNRLEQAARVARRINHPRVKIAADLYHMTLEESDIPAALQAHADCIGHVHLADYDRRLPGEGALDFASVRAVLAEIGYHGWLTFECGEPSRNQPAEFYNRLPQSITCVRKAGLV